MALANVGWILASNGKRVLMIDWDVSMPRLNLHQYIGPLLSDSGLHNTWGIVDILWDYSSRARQKARKGQVVPTEIYDELREKHYTTSVEWRFQEPGHLDLIPVVRATPESKNRIELSSWRELIDVLDGAALLTSFERDVRRRYDYILIDLPNLTTMLPSSFFVLRQMSGDIVACFTLDTDTIETTTAALKLIMNAKRGTNCNVYPVPMRVELAEAELHYKQRTTAAHRFGDWVRLLPGVSEDDYWSSIEIPSRPRYAVSRAPSTVLAAIAEEPSPLSMLAAYERLTSFVTQGQVMQNAVLTNAQRRTLIAKYDTFVPPPSEMLEAP